MITLQTVSGKKHVLKAGDRLVINTQEMTAALQLGGQPLYPIGGGDSKFMIVGMKHNDIANIVMYISGFDLQLEPQRREGLYIYVFTDKRS